MAGVVKLGDDLINRVSVALAATGRDFIDNPTAITCNLGASSVLFAPFRGYIKRIVWRK